VLFHGGTFYFSHRKNARFAIYSRYIGKEMSSSPISLISAVNKWKLFICMDHLNKKVTKTPVNS